MSDTEARQYANAAKRLAAELTAAKAEIARLEVERHDLMSMLDGANAAVAANHGRAATAESELTFIRDDRDHQRTEAAAAYELKEAAEAESARLREALDFIATLAKGSTANNYGSNIGDILRATEHALSHKETRT